MTRTEFIHQAVISMASKVIGTDGTTDKGDWHHMVLEAKDLADEVESCGHKFDE